MSVARRTKKRRQDEAHDKSPAAKPTRPAPDEIYVDFICPLTHELPVQPIRAPDGRLYDKKAFEEWVETQREDEDGKIQSPFRIVRMTKPIRTTPLECVERAIEGWIDSGVIDKDSGGEKWKRIRAKLTRIQKAPTNTISNVDEFYHCGTFFYYEDTDGYFKQDYKKAFDWFQQARKFGSVKGEAMVGICMLEGRGTAKNTSLGTHIIVQAAQKGSDLAAYQASLFFGDNRYSMKDKYLQIKFLRLAVSETARHKHLDTSCIQEATQTLEQVEGGLYTTDVYEV